MRSHLDRRAINANAKSEKAQPVCIKISDAERISGLLQAPPDCRYAYVLAHGAGAGMAHPFLAEIAHGLFDRQIGTLRYQFPYMEKGSKRPDSPSVAQIAVQAAVAEAVKILPGAALFAGGKSFGGRMTSQAQAKSPMPGVRGLIFLGFPLHPPGQASDERAKHLLDVKIPMLFLQGSQDEFADLGFLQPLIRRLGSRATLKLFPEADHSFRIPKRSGRTDKEIRAEMFKEIAAWMASVIKT